MARPTTSKIDKQRKGTLNVTRDRNHKISLMPLDHLPDPPEYFSEYEREFYYRVADALFANGTLREIDVMQIELNALWWHVYRSNRDLVCEKSVQSSKGGWVAISGAVTAVEKAARMIQAFSDRYGLNLISKDKISAPPPRDEEGDALAKIMG